MIDWRLQNTWDQHFPMTVEESKRLLAEVDEQLANVEIAPLRLSDEPPISEVE